MAEPGPEPGRVRRVFALCGAAVFLAAVAAGAALLAWNLAASASRRPRCPEPGANTTAPPGDLVPEVEELRRRLAEAAQREEALTRQLNQAEGVRQELEEALRGCEGRQSRLQTQLMTLKTEMDEAKAQGTQMGAENGALTGVLGCKVLHPGSPGRSPAQSATPPDPLRAVASNCVIVSHPWSSLLSIPLPRSPRILSLPPVSLDPMGLGAVSHSVSPRLSPRPGALGGASGITQHRGFPWSSWIWGDG
ncbi:hypothetical protein E2I00_018640 [Balaenoptera physalus]|uniref:Coiled-coil domain-containing protein 194 n=1 Tax=Balaenoptera physalus TaxID=9770 RepID=A0A6A1QH64_BALPH|nr:hypothetical protein E2I00_018640 [Balaenoptera physalus]